MGNMNNPNCFDHESINILINWHWERAKPSFYLEQCVPYVIVYFTCIVWTTQLKDDLGDKDGLRAWDWIALVIIWLYCLWTLMVTTQKFYSYKKGRNF